MTRRVLIVEDDRAMSSLLATTLREEGYGIEERRTVAEALERLRAEDFSAVLADLNLGGGQSGLELCRLVPDIRPDVPVVVITAYGSLETAVEAIRAGAYDFIPKPVEMEAVGIAIARAVERQELRAEVLRLRATERRPFEGLLGTSSAMQPVYDLVERVADSNSTVLITGESGTGKEVVARALHQRGKRCDGPFVAVNCAALPEPLLESELFGHVRGAFTDAKEARRGLLVEASRGTLFLDEIGDMPLGLQPKLLRALEERKVRPVGASSEVPFDVRIVAATHRDLDATVEAGRFREDLYYRLNVIGVELPPLRSRGGDILLIAQHFLEDFASRAGKPVLSISEAAAKKLLFYPWPGNVRELRNCMERAVALARLDQITVEDLPDRVRGYESKHVLVGSDDLRDLVPLDEMEKRYILRVLDAAGGNRSLAAKTLGIDRKTLYRRLADYGLGPES